MDISPEKISRGDPLVGTANNIPLQAPLYPSNGSYGSDDFEGITVLVEVNDAELSRQCAGTPFIPQGNRIWVEFMTMPTCEGLKPYSGGGIIIPARCKSITGGYYAYCYVDTDDSLALGRGAYGYPKKLARMEYQRTGHVITARFIRPEFELALSLMMHESSKEFPPVPRYPHLLYQILPCASSNEAMLKRVIARDTSKGSTATTRYGEGALDVITKRNDSELSWLENAKVVGGVFARGSFTGALAKVVHTEFVHPELKVGFSED